MREVFNEGVVDAEVTPQTDTLPDHSGHETQIEFGEPMFPEDTHRHADRAFSFFFGEGDFEPGVVKRGLNQRTSTTMRALGIPQAKPDRKEYFQ